MRIEASVVFTLALMAWSPGPSAQPAGESVDQVTDQGPAQEQGAPAGVEETQGQGTPPTAGGTTNPGRAPTLFVPRETISPDSVIAFPADI